MEPFVAFYQGDRKRGMYVESNGRSRNSPGEQQEVLEA